MTFEEEVDQYFKLHAPEKVRPHKLRAVLFDMDGVLFDSMPNHADSWEKVCTEFNLPMKAQEAYMHEGRTGASTINLLAQRHWHRDATPEEIERIYAEKCRLFNECPEAPQMPGALQVLENAKKAGLTIVIVTGSGQHSLLDRLEQNYPGFFTPELIVSSKDVTHGKPHPEPYLKGLAKAQCEPHEAWVVENAPLGVRAAVAAGIFTLAVNTGPLPESALLNEGANHLFTGMTALAQQFQTLLHAWEA